VRLAFVSSSFPPYTSGVAVNAAVISSGLAELGHQVGIFTSGYDLNKICKSSHVSPKLKIFRLPSVKNPFNKSHLLLSPNHKSLITNLKSFNPEVIHLQEPNFFLFPAIKQYAVKNRVSIVSAHHFPPEFITNQLPNLLRQEFVNNFIVDSVVCLYNQSDLVITPTLTMQRLLYDHGLKIPAKVISNGVDINKFTPPLSKKALMESDCPVVLYLGRIDNDKNLDTLINAAKLIKFPCEIWLAGSGKAVPFLKSLTLSLSLNNVRFLGYIPEEKKADIYRQSTVFVIPSTAEAQSIVSLEAAACGLPLILADAAALPELISSEHPNGLLFTPNNPIDLAAKTDSLLANPSQLAQFSKNSRLLAKKHGIKNVINLYEKVYLSLC
jgi:glycosyltransferase involved in cell wall biosynthesis